jgi:anti-anti-sigma factor
MVSAPAEHAVTSQRGAALLVQQTTTASARRLALSGEIDLANAAALEELLIAACDHGTDSVVVDLSGLGFMDLSGFRAIVAGQQAARRAGSRLIVRAGSPAVDLLFGLVGASRVLDELR